MSSVVYVFCPCPFTGCLHARIKKIRPNRLETDPDFGVAVMAGGGWGAAGVVGAWGASVAWGVKGVMLGKNNAGTLVGYKA